MPAKRAEVRPTDAQTQVNASDCPETPRRGRALSSAARNYGRKETSLRHPPAVRATSSGRQIARQPNLQRQTSIPRCRATDRGAADTGQYESPAAFPKPRRTRRRGRGRRQEPELARSARLGYRGDGSVRGGCDHANERGAARHDAPAQKHRSPDANGRRKLPVRAGALRSGVA